MTQLARLSLAAFALALSTAPALAVCYADYKAKMDDPLRLHYGVIEIPDAVCDTDAAFAEIAPRVATAGWELLEVMSVFDATGLDERRADAGQYYLAF